MKQWNTKRGNGFGSGGLGRVLLPASVLLGACSADPVDLGDGRLGVDRNALESYAAVWEGYAEAYEFRSGSDRVRIVLDEQGNGTVTFGEGEPLPEPTDPDAELLVETLSEAANGPGGSKPFEAFPYRLTDVLVEDERLRARSPMNDVYTSACALQTPHAVNHDVEFEFDSGFDGGYIGQRDVPYACVEELGVHYTNAGECYMGASHTPISCSRAELCNNLCGCSESACFPLPTDEVVRFDAALNDSGDRLEGTLLGLRDDRGVVSRVTVRLTRVAAP